MLLEAEETIATLVVAAGLLLTATLVAGLLETSVEATEEGLLEAGVVATEVGLVSTLEAGLVATVVGLVAGEVLAWTVVEAELQSNPMLWTPMLQVDLGTFDV